MSERTIAGLKCMQAAPLSVKVRMTESRIRDWVDEYGEDGVYVSFSGGKDSTVLLDIARKMHPNIKAMFVDVPTQYPELRQFVKKFPNVDITRPEINFVQACEKYGFPFFSKEIAESIQGARKYLQAIMQQCDNPIASKQASKQAPYRYWYERITGTGNYQKNPTTPSIADEIALMEHSGGDTTESIAESEELASLLNTKMHNREGGQNQRLAIMLGMLTKDGQILPRGNIPSKDRSKYSLSGYAFTLEAPFEISNKCCDVMKKLPAYEYTKQTGRVPITAQMAEESYLRTQKWLQHGCNMFDAKHPKSNPMSFWTEQDVLKYIRENNISICSVYGDIVSDAEEMGQMNFADFGIENAETEEKLHCTGCQRTGCVLCAFGAHLEREREKARFVRLKKTHPKMYQLLDICKNNGVTYREALEWINAQGHQHIYF